MSVLDEVVRSQGFRDEQEMSRLVSSVDLSTPQARDAFQEWKMTDGSREGLVSLLEKPSMEKDDIVDRLVSHAAFHGWTLETDFLRGLLHRDKT